VGGREVYVEISKHFLSILLVGGLAKSIQLNPTYINTVLKSYIFGNFGSYSFGKKRKCQTSDLLNKIKLCRFGSSTDNFFENFRNSFCSVSENHDIY